MPHTRISATTSGAKSSSWSRGRRIVHTSTLAQTSEHPSEVSVSFVPRDAGCTVRFEHGGWDRGNAAFRSKFTDWPLILARVAALADAAAASPVVDHPPG